MEKIPFQSKITNLGSEIKSNITLVSRVKILTAFFSVTNYKKLHILLSRPNGATGPHNCLKYVFDNEGKIIKMEYVQVISNLAIIPVFLNLNIGWIEANPEEIGSFANE